MATTYCMHNHLDPLILMSTPSGREVGSGQTAGCVVVATVVVEVVVVSSN